MLPRIANAHPDPVPIFSSMTNACDIVTFAVSSLVSTRKDLVLELFPVISRGRLGVHPNKVNC